MAQFIREVILQATVKKARSNPVFDEYDEDFQKAVEGALLNELSRDMRAIYGMEIAVEIKASQHGSLVVFYRIVVTSLGALSIHKNEAITLICKQSQLVIGALKKKFGEFDTTISVVHPGMRAPYAIMKSYPVILFLIALCLLLAAFLTFMLPRLFPVCTDDFSVVV